MKNIYYAITLFLFPLITFGADTTNQIPPRDPHNPTVYNTTQENLASTKTSIELSGKLSSANAANYDAAKNGAGITIENCTDLAKTLEGGLPTGWLITSEVVSVDKSVECKLTGPGPTVAKFSATGVKGIK